MHTTDGAMGVAAAADRTTPLAVNITTATTAPVEKNLWFI
jgi:hypothetical protein